MEQLKVKKKDVVILNTIVFLFLSFVFLYLQYAYRHQLSPFSVVYLKKSGELFWYVAMPILISCLLIWRHHTHSIWYLNFCTILVSFKVIEGLFIEFNKVIVIALFFYVVISYFLYQLLAQYLQMASINPNYQSHDLFPPLLRAIPCQIVHEDLIIPGMLTNWDEESCFIQMQSARALPAKVQLTINFQGRDFTQQGEVVAQALDLKGVGIKFQELPKDLKIFNWTEFTELIHELGFKPERLR